MLASKFSGRWDDSIEKDKDGNFFIDEDATVFMQLLDYLRKCDKRKNNDILIPPPVATFDFCWMLEYYDLIFSVYPHEWVPINGEGSSSVKPDHPDKPFVLNSPDSMCSFELDLDKERQRKPAHVRSFLAEFALDTKGQIGWLREGTFRDTVKMSSDAFALYLDDREFSQNSKPGKSFEVDLTECFLQGCFKVRCTWNEQCSTYHIEVVGSNPMASRSFRDKARRVPVISCTGQVTISELAYGF